jgi:hypothetical protein
VLGVALSGSRSLRAQELGPTLLSYRAPSGCPTVTDFQGSVKRRSTRVRFVAEGPHDRELSITVHQIGSFSKGELRLNEADGSLRQRNVRFTTCAEAVEGLALIAVVSLDPQALLRSDAPAEPAVAAKPASKAAPVQTKAARPRESTRAPKRESVRGGRPPTVEQGLGGEFAVAAQALPAPALGASLFLDVAFRSGSGFAPLFRGAISHVQRRGLKGGAGEANFTLTLATLSACPLRFASGPFVVRPCVFSSGGALHAWGSKTTNLQQRTRPYGALGGSVLLFAAVSQSLEIIADVALGTSLLRDTFGFQGDQPWKTPAFYLSSGLGARFVFR